MKRIAKCARFHLAIDDRPEGVSWRREFYIRNSLGGLLYSLREHLKKGAP